MRSRNHGRPRGARPTQVMLRASCGARVAIHAITRCLSRNRHRCDTPGRFVGDDPGDRSVTAVTRRVSAPPVPQQRVAVRHDGGRQRLRVRFGAGRLLAGDVLHRMTEGLRQPGELVEHVRGPGEMVDAVRPQRASFGVETPEGFHRLPSERDACVLNRHGTVVPARGTGDAIGRTRSNGLARSGPPWDEGREVGRAPLLAAPQHQERGRPPDGRPSSPRSPTRPVETSVPQP